MRQTKRSPNEHVLNTIPKEGKLVTVFYFDSELVVTRLKV